MPADISVQLYSVRNQLATDPEATIAKLHQIGFRSVEPFGLPELGSLPQILRQFSIKVPSAHGSVLASTVQAVGAAQQLGVDLLIEPYQPAERFESMASLRDLAAELSEATETAARSAITVGYHNHAHELTSVIEGQPALYLLAELTPAELKFEVDLFWCQAAGFNAVDVVRQLGPRVVALHAKDAPLTGDVPDQLPAGRGSVPIAASRAAAPKALVVAEFDEYAGDIFEGLAESFNYLTRKG